MPCVLDCIVDFLLRMMYDLVLYSSLTPWVERPRVILLKVSWTFRSNNLAWNFRGGATERHHFYYGLSHWHGNWAVGTGMAECSKFAWGLPHLMRRRLGTNFGRILATMTPSILKKCSTLRSFQHVQNITGAWKNSWTFSQGIRAQVGPTETMLW